MSSATLSCPTCGSTLRPAQPVAAGRKVRCPSCQTVFAANEQSQPPAPPLEITPRSSSPSRPARRLDDDPPRRRAVRQRDDDFDDDEGFRPRRRRREDADSNRGLIIGLAIGGAVLLLLIGGGVAALVYALRGPAASDPPAVALADTKQHAPGPAKEDKPAAAQPVAAAPAEQPAHVAAKPPVPQPEINTPPAGDAVDGTIPAATLQALKAATVYIKVRAGTTMASGSGFLFRTDGKVGYIITNHHVVDMPDEVAAGMPGPRFPPFMHIGPRLRPMPQFRFHSRFLQQTKAKPNVTVVFGSGTVQPQSLNAELLASDEDADLAVFRVVSTQDLPAPLNLDQQASLVETLPVYVFGFPFGDMLAVGDRDPAVTVGKASISSLRQDDHGQLESVQISGEINPGNSGGPIVDGKGHLVGVAVKKVSNTTIGFAIPTAEVLLMLDGRLARTVVLRANGAGPLINVQGDVCILDRQHRIKSANNVQLTLSSNSLLRGPRTGTTTVIGLARLVDPLGKIKSAKVHYTAGDVSQNQANPARDSPWRPIPGATTVDLKINGQTADAVLENVSLHNGDGLYTFQFSYLVGGHEVYTQPRATRLAPVKAPRPGACAGAPPVFAARPPQAPDFPSDGRPLETGEQDKLLKALSSGDFFTKKNALDRLGNITDVPDDHAAVAKALAPLTRDDNPFIRRGAVKALAVWGTKDSAPALLDALKHEDVFTKQEAMRTLGKLQEKSALAPLAAFLTDGLSRGVAQESLRSMGSIAEPEVRKYLRSADIWVKKAACEVLKDMGTTKSIRALTAVVRDPNIHVRVHVAPTARDAILAIRARAKPKK